MLFLGFFSDPYSLFENFIFNHSSFSLYLFVSFIFREIISWCVPIKLLVENLLASTLRIHSFSSHLRSVVNREQHEKHLYNQSIKQNDQEHLNGNLSKVS